MKFLVLSLSLFLSVAFAADRTAAYEAVCKKLSYESSKASCLEKLKGHQFYEQGALDICSRLSYESSKIECISTIADKTYEAYEIDACQSQVYESNKLSCLKTAGTAYVPPMPTCVSKGETLSQLNASLDDLHSGNFTMVESRLIYLISKVSNCKN